MNKKKHKLLDVKEQQLAATGLQIQTTDVLLKKETTWTAIWHLVVSKQMTASLSLRPAAPFADLSTGHVSRLEMNQGIKVPGTISKNVDAPEISYPTDVEKTCICVYIHIYKDNMDMIWTYPEGMNQCLRSETVLWEYCFGWMCRSCYTSYHSLTHFARMRNDK